VNESRAARELIRDASRNVSRARDELASAERASGELSNRRAVLSESRAQVGAQLSETVEALAQAEQSLKSCPDLAGLDAALAQINAQVATDRGGLAEARAAHEGLERENAARARRLEAIASERANWLERAANAENHLAALAARSTEAAAEVAGIAEAPDEIAARRRQLMHQLTEAEKRRQEAADTLALAETKSREADKLATEAIGALSQGREARGRAEERLMAARERREEGEARIREALNCEPHEALKHSGLTADAALPDPAQVERNLERLKIERERLGAVNLRAEEEQTELSERLET
jgi:chromosome segregation protein